MGRVPVYYHKEERVGMTAVVAEKITQLQTSSYIRIVFVDARINDFRSVVETSDRAAMNVQMCFLGFPYVKSMPS